MNGKVHKAYCNVIIIVVKIDDNQICTNIKNIFGGGPHGLAFRELVSTIPTICMILYLTNSTHLKLRTARDTRGLY